MQVRSLVGGKFPWRRRWQRIPVFLPRKCHGQRSLGVYNLWDHKSWTRLSQTWFFLTDDLYEFLKNIFWLQVPYQIRDLQIFFPILWIAFLLSCCCPLKHRFLILMKTNLFFLLFLLLLMLSILYLRNHCLTQDHKDILLFSSDSFIVLALTFKSLNHLS